MALPGTVVKHSQQIGPMKRRIKRLLSATNVVTLLNVCQLALCCAATAAPDAQAYRGFEQNLERSLSNGWLVRRSRYSPSVYSQAQATFDVDAEGYFDNVQCNNYGCNCTSAFTYAERVFPPPGAHTPVHVTAIFTLTDTNETFVHCTASRPIDEPPSAPSTEKGANCLAHSEYVREYQPVARSAADTEHRSIPFEDNAQPSMKLPVIGSTWAGRAPRIEHFSADDWQTAAKRQVSIPHGFLMTCNDDDSLFLCFDMTADTGSKGGSKPSNEYARVMFDNNNNRRLNPGSDVTFDAYCKPESHGSMWKRTPIRPGAWSSAEAAPACMISTNLGISVNSKKRHRIWTIQIPLAELGAKPGQELGFGAQLRSSTSAGSVDWPPSHPNTYADFASLQLAKP